MTTRTKTTEDDGYALDLTGPVQHVVTALGKASGDALSIDDLAGGYTHFAGDLARVRKHQNLDNDAEAVAWIIRRAVEELTRNGKRGKVQLDVQDGWVALAPGVAVDDLKWRGEKVYTPPNIHQILGDPFNPMSGRYAGNVRKQTGKDGKRADLKMSMKALGWLPNQPAIKDARTGVTITGHRRLDVAKELRAEGVDIPDNIRYYDFEAAAGAEGDPADVARMDEARGSNFGFLPPTPEERAETALWFSEKRGMTQQQIAAILGVSQQTVSRDLNKIITQMGTELEPLIAASIAGIQRGLTQTQIGAEQGLANNSITMAKAFAVAVDRIKRAAEPTPLPIPPEPELLPETPATSAVDDFLNDPATGTTHERPERPADPEPRYDAELCEHALGTCPEDCDCRCDYCMDRMEKPPGSRPAVNPPSHLPPAPVPHGAGYCGACARSGVGACDDFPNCPAGVGAEIADPLPPEQDGPLSVAGWWWDEEAQRWTVQRGTVLITVSLPFDQQPSMPAHLFGAALIVERSEQRTDDDPDAV